MKIAILGYGLQGRSAYEYWQAGNEITICDTNEKVKLPDGVSGQLGDDYLQALDSFDLIVRSPSVHPNDIVAANSADILDKVTTVTNEFFKVCPSKNIIGVTGTKGKGTTSSLIAKMLEVDGQAVHLGGNIGTPPLDLLRGAGATHEDAMQGVGEERTEPYSRYGEGALEPTTQQRASRTGGVASSDGEQAGSGRGIQPGDWVVLELANFQLIDLKYSPHIAVCLMVVPEHLDWHGDEQEYFTAKSQLFRWQTADDVAIYFAENDISRKVAAAGQGRKVPYFQAPGAEVKSGEIVISDKSICKTSELKLLGQHNWQNACAAVTAVWQISQNLDAMRSALTSFSGLEHRLELVRELDGVKYYNDSFGTTPETAIVAIEAFEQPKVSILGGSDKGADYTDLAKVIASSDMRKVLLIGEQAGRIQEALEQAGFRDFEPGGKNIEEIVSRARADAQPGDVVLFSTACASFDMFKNYKDRGEKYKKAVLALT